MEGETPDSQRHGPVGPGDGGTKSVLELRRRAPAKIEGLDAGETQEQLAEDGLAEIIVDVLLGEELLQVGDELEALKQRLRRQVAGLRALGGCQEELAGVEVAEVEAADDGAERRVGGDVVEKFAEDARVWDGDFAVKGCEGCVMQGLGGQEQGHEVDVAAGDAVGGDVEGEKLDDGGWGSASQHTSFTQ